MAKSGTRFTLGDLNSDLLPKWRHLVAKSGTSVDVSLTFELSFKISAEASSG